ncbi:helix-turn-helix domain-containing protein [Sulfuricystis multivorans]|uniref:helix-turn-helix domain-containing protein n=1 Tax=Sulfuricystis multivorans TaxID=2211108 RepID=UPI000F8185F1|nr:helix-turn-helix domain-containing protein [Sulfuricystis multivorans]
MSAIGERLRKWRKHLGLTQEEFSSLTGLHIGVIRKYELGINVPGGEALVAIGQTGVNLNWLLLGQGDMCAEAEAKSSALDDAYLRRLEAVKGLLDGLGEDRRSAVLEEIFSRVQEAKRVAGLEELVREMARKLG